MRGRLLFCLLAALFLLSGCKAPSDSAPEEEPLRPEFLESPEGDPEIPPETPEEAEAPEPAAPLQELPEEPEPWAFVRAADYVPGVVEELRYAGTDNLPMPTCATAPPKNWPPSKPPWRKRDWA